MICPEEARPFPGFEHYEVTKDGRVWSCKNKIFLTPHHNVKGYLRVRVQWRPQIRLFVHRMVAICWVPNPDPVNKIYVNHLDEYIFNNHYTNLVWMTPAENNEYSKMMKQKRIDELNKEVPF